MRCSLKVLLIAAALAQTTFGASLLALSKTDRTMAIVDPATLKILGKLPTGPDPHEVIASTDGRTAYVSNYGGGAYNTLAVLDLMAPKALPSVDLGALRGPHGLLFSGGKLWFTAEAAKAIGSYDPGSSKVDLILGTGQDRTHMIYVTSDLRRIVTSNIASATMTVIEKMTNAGGRGPQTDWKETVIPVGRGAEGFDVSPDGKEIWAANAQDGTISVIDFAAKKVVATLNANVQGANRLKFTPDGKLVFVTLINGPEVVVLDTAMRNQRTRIPVGHGAEGLLMQPDGSRAFVSCTPDDYIALVDLKTLQVTGHLDVGKQPDGLAWVQGSPK
ncbi:MAG TPA: hypothetical protein VKB79_15095 [Bryobacteraceae bacterium]|nr:hypothetical protein [Bryobacteraceae bacterium]